MSKTHEAIMVKEILEYLILNKNGTYVDCTFGAGGHSEAIIQTLNPKGVLIGFDRDKNTADHMPYNLKSDSRFTLINDAFSNMNKYLQGNELDGILIDLGILGLNLLKNLREIVTCLGLDEYFKNNQSINYKSTISEKRPQQIMLKIIFNQA